MINEWPRSKALRWLTVPVALIVMTMIVNFLNRPSTDRLDAARRELARAGHSNADVNRSQVARNMALCDVSQVFKNRGYAYDWETDTNSGVFCFPTDGRPTRILLD